MSGGSLPLVFALSALATAGCVVLAVRSLLGIASDRRLRRPAAAEAKDAADEPEGGLLHRLRGLGRGLRPADEVELAELRTKLAHAGLSARSAVDLYGTVQVLGLILAAVFALPWLLVDEPGFALIGIALSALIGLMVPRLWLSVRTQGRQEKISLALASTLDLLTTCMEAGLGLEQAVTRVSDELEHSEPEMAEELSMTVAEIRAGIPTSQAFRKLGERVGLDELKMVCGVIVQATTMGASIGRMLRQYATSWRTQRMLDLEEHAGKVTAKLTLPLTLCLLPSAIVAMLGPAAIVVMSNVG